MWQSMPSKRVVIALMNGIGTTSGQCRPTARSAVGPCTAISARWSARSSRTPGGQPRREMRVVRLLRRRVDDQEQHAVLGRIGRARHHQVVEDAAVVVEQLRVALAAGREADDVARHQRLERARDRLVVGADEERLAHVRDVEQAGRAAHMIVLGDDAVGVLHRHVVAGERHHAGAARDMQRVQRGLLQRRGRRRRRGVAGRDRAQPRARSRAVSARGALRPTVEASSFRAPGS